MNEPKPESAAAMPLATHLNILFPQLEKIDVASLANTVTDRWYNQTLCRVNASVVRLGVNARRIPLLHRTIGPVGIQQSVGMSKT